MHSVSMVAVYDDACKVRRGSPVLVDEPAEYVSSE